MNLLKVALVGNPNVGKSTLFNNLTGLKQRVGNYPGTTVEKRVGKFWHKQTQIQVYDFPGTYTLYPKSLDEEIVFNILNNPQSEHFPDKVLVIGSPMQLKRSFLLYQQVRDLGIPCIFVLNMVDEAYKKGFKIVPDAIETITQEKLLQIDARKGENLECLKDRMLKPFPVFDELFTVSALYEKAVEKVMAKLHIEREYKAWQYLAQPSVKHLSPHEHDSIAQIIEEQHIVPTRLQVAETIQRHEQIEPLCTKVVVREENTKELITEKLDAVLTHPFWGYFIFFSLLFVAFQAIFSWAEVPKEIIEDAFGAIQNGVHSIFPVDGLLGRLIADGIIPGIGAVLSYVPQILILILFLLLMEESGYMSRVVFLMDRWMRPFGLNGKSVVPLMSGAACAIPGVMAARNIENNKERLITILVTPFMTCSARLPIYSALIALVIPKQYVLGIINIQGLVLMGLYLLGIAAALLFALFFKRILKSNYKSYLIMEIPDYRIPHWKNILLGLWEKLSSFVIGAGQIILAVSVVLWVLGSFGISNKYKNAEQTIAMQAKEHNWGKDEQAHHLESYKLEHSFLGNIGKTIEPVFRPLGYDWRISIGVLSSFAAREVFISTMASIYSLGSDMEDQSRIVTRMENERKPNGEKVFNLATGLSLMLFYAFAMQCLSTLAIVKKETGTWKWPLIQMVCMSGFAYIVAMFTYQILS